MTIKELEERTGMARANIRFYESEGLLSPARRENGYRDYSEEDVKTLEKIHLLRQLHLDIDTIRLVQKGELPLERALFTLLTRLEGDRDALDRAAQVCRELERTGVEYGALEPKPWLEPLGHPQRPQLTPPPKTVAEYDIRPREGWVEHASSHPVMRWLARWLDTTLWGMVADAVLILGFGWNTTMLDGFLEWLVGLLGVAVTLAAEPFLLHFWGWTLGKRIFGLKLRGPSGDKVTLGEGFARSRRIFCYEFLFLVPLVNLVLIGVCIYRLYHDEDLPWDVDSEYQYTQEEQRLPWLKFIAALAAGFAAAAVVILLARLPAHWGSLTAEEYYDNVNHYLNSMTNSTDRLSDTGEWRNGSISFESLPDIQLELENGLVTGVTLTEESQETFVYQRNIVYQIALLSLAAAERGTLPHAYDQWTALFPERIGDFETELDGVRVSQEVEYEGYNVSSDGSLLSAQLNGDQHYRRTVTITLTG